MKKYWVIVVILFPAVSFAQLKLAIQAGANDAGLHNSIKNNSISTKSNIGWQAGVYTQYGKQKWFFYSGLNLARYNFSQSVGDFAFDKYTYHPLYLQLPVGIGYIMPLHKAIQLKWYGGMQGLLGVGGKLREPYYVECFTTPCPAQGMIEKDILFGNNNPMNSWESFTKAAANVQAGTSVSISDKIETGISYAWGITDIRNAKDDYTGKQHLAIWDVSVKYYLHSK